MSSDAEIITVAICCTNIGQNSNEPNLIDIISPDKYTILLNTVGWFDAKIAIRTGKLARELLGGHNLGRVLILKIMLKTRDSASKRRKYYL